ncbi:hypothetical protein SDC9_139769 [bioreactor metagenome]|uniref:Uncharacterized protein n=1 Tax=bioreactor metagenome TaxID=1076179 RepID=A0A645DT13_9ZZZZ
MITGAGIYFIRNKSAVREVHIVCYELTVEIYVKHAGRVFRVG